MSRLNSVNDTLGPRPRFKSFAGLKDIDRYQDQFQKGDRDSVLPDKKGLAVRKRYLKRLMNPSSLSHSKEVQVMASKTKPPQKIVENKALTGKELWKLLFNIYGKKYAVLYGSNSFLSFIFSFIIPVYLF